MVFCGVGVLKGEDFPVWPVSDPVFGAPQLHICSTPTFPLATSEDDDVWFCVFSLCFRSPALRLLPCGERRGASVSTLWRKSAQMLAERGEGIEAAAGWTARVLEHSNQCGSTAAFIAGFSGFGTL